MPIMLPALAAGLAAFFTRYVVGRLFKRPPTVPKALGVSLLVAMFAVYVVVFSVLSINRHEGLQSNAFDLAIFDQAIWNTAHGRPYEVSIKIDDLAGTTLLGDHFSPAIAVLAPIYWLWDDVRALLVAQTLLLGLGVIPIYRLARHLMTGPWPALALAAGYLLSPTLSYTNLYDFHEIALAVPCLAFAAEALVRRAFRPLVLWLGLALLSKEEIGFVVAGFGAALIVRGLAAAAWRRRRPSQRQSDHPPSPVGSDSAGGRASPMDPVWRREVSIGFALAALGLGWSAIVIGQVIPWLEGSGSYTYVGRYGDLGDTPTAVALALISNPLGTIARTLTPVKVEFVLSFLAPFALLPVFAPELLLLAAPTWGYLLVSSYPAQYTLGRQYGVAVVPLVAICACLGWARLGHLAGRRSAALGTGIAMGALVAAVQTYRLLGPGPLADRFDPDRYRVSQRSLAAEQLLARIPPNESVSAQENLAPHLSHRRGLFLFPSLHGADWVVVDNEGGTYPIDRGTWDSETRDLLANRLYELVDQTEGIALFRRRTSIPGTPASVTFGSALRIVAVEFLGGTNNAEVGLYWQVLERSAGETPDGIRQILRVFSADGRLAREIARPPRPGSGYWETGRGIPGAILRERFQVGLLPGPGPYRIEVEVRAEPAGVVLERAGDLPVDVVE